MGHAQRTDEHLTPEQRRERLRAFADRMLIALEDLDTPQTRDDVVKGVRTALMIERLYARCDASETQAYKRAATSIEDQVTLKSKLKWSGYYFDKAPDVPFVTLKPGDLAGLQWPRPESAPMADLRADLRTNIDACKSSGKSAQQPALEPQPEPVKASESVQPRPEPEPAAPAKPQGKPLTPEQMTLRDRVLNTEPIPLPRLRTH
ncbi:hypothetical protein [Asticcacaulis sp. AND118]|uniref:hypothetical protein n=1 Tax=Asticcacaulis sp. AND118 TaxID=2840468 RepID=UPI001CFFDC8C|nr:hypothetical protein [Asticcacaulis sp. AND118]UDF05334.1 hypothetical protein LH365_14070 [Asticcacaulis sp. AND118]